MIRVVHLVGAGPGDPGLITVRGRAVLDEAEVVIADRLVPAALLDLGAGVEVIVRGAERGGISQEEINRLLVDKAKAGHRVVRLKGGDPFVFGRGGEEAEALLAAGIPYEVVPGVTAAIAAPAYAGIPITHRGIAGAVAFVTGHEADDKDAGGIDWPSLAKGAATIVLYMSVSHLEAIARRLIAAGRAASTPVAVIERGTTPSQRTVVGTLADIAEKARTAGVAPPALTIVGEVVRLRAGLSWFEKRPLLGRRILALSASGSDVEEVPDASEIGDVEREIERRGGELHWAYPLCVREKPEGLEQLVHALKASPRPGWLALTSPRAVLALDAALEGAELDGRALAGVRIAALGGRTRTMLQIQVRLVADVTAIGGGRALAEAIIQTDPTPLPVLMPRAAKGRSELPDTLRAAGFPVAVIPVYETLPDDEEIARLLAEHARAPFSAVAFASPRHAEALLDAGFSVAGVRVGAIGQTTAAYLAERKVNVDLIAPSPSLAGLALALADALTPRK